jgi:PAS domain S-box-containing protein
VAEPLPPLGAQDLCIEQLRLHRQARFTAMYGAAVLAGLVVVSLRGTVPWEHLAAWVVCVAVGLLLRTIAAGRRTDDLPEPGRPARPDAMGRSPSWRRRLWRVRLAFGLHGMAWGLAAVLAWPGEDTGLQTFLTLVLTLMSAGSLAMTVFDLKAAALFIACALVPLWARLLAQPEADVLLNAATVVLLLGFLASHARRARTTLLEALQLRRQELLRTDALQRSDAQLRVAEQLAGIGSFDWDPRSGELHWSDQHFRLWGIEPGSLKPDYATFRGGVHPDDLPRLEAQLQGALAGGGRYACSHRVCRPDGSVIEIHGRGQVDFDADGQPWRMIGTVQDVSERARARAALDASVQNLRRTLNATGDAIFASDATEPAQPLLFVNERMLQMWGMGDRDPASVTPADVIAAARPLFKDPPREIARIQEIIASGDAHEDRLELNDGRVLVRRCIPSLGPDRAVRVWGFRDITREEQALRALRASEAEQRALLDAFPGAILCFDSGALCVYANERAAALLGRPAAALLGRDATELLGGRAELVLREGIAELLQGRSVEFEWQQPQPGGGATVDLLVTLALGLNHRNGEQLCYAFATDVSSLKRVETALVAAKEEAERASRAKSQFLSSMSHELRTPMNAILGFGQLLESDPAHALPQRQAGYVSEILRGGRHLLTLINEVLDLARIEAGRMAVSLEPVQVRELVEDCMALVQPLAQEHEITLGLVTPEGHPDARGCHAHVLADRTRLKQVLLNLLSNAIKYNRRGGRVDLSCSPMPAADGQAESLRIEVRDTGHGLSPADMERLFQAFERLGADRTAIEGAGIGLALSRRLADLMRGQIGVSSTEGVGSMFWISLERVAFEAAPVPVPVPEDALLRRRLLYIEDNPVNAVVMEAMLARLPEVRLSVATHPMDGLAAARRERPDLILLDIQLPDMDGYEVLRRLRADEATRDIPVIAVSANALSCDLDRGHGAGFANYLTKPVDMAQLLGAVSASLSVPRRTGDDGSQRGDGDPAGDQDPDAPQRA